MVLRVKMTKLQPQKIPLLFFRGAGGHEPVREWLKSLDKQDRHAIGLDLMRVQWRWPVGMPLCRPMGQALWEVRIQLKNNRIARVMFCAIRGQLVALSGFIKKSRQSPDHEIAVARKRQKELEQ
jgi:phage-related protein